MDVKEETKYELNGNSRYLFISFYKHLCSNFEWKKKKLWEFLPDDQ